MKLSLLFLCLYTARPQCLFPLAHTNTTNITYRDRLTLEEKVGQMLMVSFSGTSCNGDALRLITEAHVGGIMYYQFSNGLTSPEQVRLLSRSLQEVAQKHSPYVPLLISVDQEGGTINRLIPKHNFTTFPSQEIIGAVNDTTLTEKTAYAIGRQLRAVGISLNMAPVADINSNADNPVIGSRSFGTTATHVIPHVHAALRGYQKANTIACIKHFPGHGDTDTDSHTTLPVITHVKEILNERELKPFATSLHAPAIMTAHIMVPTYDQTACATMSSIIITDLLRKTMHYRGIIITDSLLMQGALHKNDLSTAAIRSIQAGCDIVLISGRMLIDQQYRTVTTDEVIQTHKAIVNAVRVGHIPLARINESVDRILSLKQQYSVGYIPRLTLERLHKRTHGASIEAIATTILQKHTPLSKQ